MNLFVQGFGEHAEALYLYFQEGVYYNTPKPYRNLAVKTRLAPYVSTNSGFSDSFSP